MNNVMIVTQPNIALRLDSKGEKSVCKAQGMFLPSLLAIKEVLNTIPTDSIVESTEIYLANTLRGLATGSVKEYVRSGKTISGTVLTQEEINTFKEVYELYASRIFNVNFKEIKFIKKDNVELQELKKNALAELSKIPKANTNSNKTETIIVDAYADMRAMLQESYKEALANKDIETMKFLMEQIKELPEPTAQVVNTNSSNNSINKPEFDSIEDLVNHHIETEANNSNKSDTTETNQEVVTYEEGTTEIEW